MHTELVPDQRSYIILDKSQRGHVISHMTILASPKRELRNGRRERSSVSASSENQLSIGTPLESWSHVAVM